MIVVGSFFADEFTSFLKKYARCNTLQIYFSEGILNTYSLLQVIKFFLGISLEEPFANAFTAHYSKQSIEALKQKLFHATDFIFTLSLSEAWYDKDRSSFLFQSISKEDYNDSRHKFKLISSELNHEYLSELIDIIKQVNPNANIFFSLTPVPMNATFSGESPIHRTMVSNSLLITGLLKLRNIYTNIYYLPLVDYINATTLMPFSLDLRHIDKAFISACIALTFDGYFAPKTIAFKSIAAVQLLKFYQVFNINSPCKQREIKADLPSIYWHTCIIKPVSLSDILAEYNKGIQNFKSYLFSQSRVNPHLFPLLKEIAILLHPSLAAEQEVNLENAQELIELSRKFILGKTSAPSFLN